MMLVKRALIVSITAASLTGCVATGDQYRSDVYGANQVNQAQEVKTVEIIAIQPARVAVNNRENRDTAQSVGLILGGVLGAVLGHQVDPHHGGGEVAGALAGAAIGSAVGGGTSPGTALVPGVQLTFRINGRIYNSAQVGRLCEFKYGPAIMISTDPTNTRIQPNNPYGCPPEPQH